MPRHRAVERGAERTPRGGREKEPVEEEGTRSAHAQAVELLPLLLLLGKVPPLTAGGREEGCGEDEAEAEETRSRAAARCSERSERRGRCAPQ